VSSSFGFFSFDFSTLARSTDGYGRSYAAFFELGVICTFAFFGLSSQKVNYLRDDWYLSSSSSDSVIVSSCLFALVYQLLSTCVSLTVSVESSSSVKISHPSETTPMMQEVSHPRRSGCRSLFVARSC